MNGGYVMFDASVLDLDNGGTLSGLYAKMQELFNSGKPLLLCNVNFEGSIYKAVFVGFNFYGDKYNIDFINAGVVFQCIISSDDSYTMTE